MPARAGHAGPLAAVVALLDGEVAYEIEERRLTLTAGDRGLGFTAP
ncbi:MAG TPA: hypothetical protein VEW93_01965 [Acidimicrobiales bacterium]|nr:hypothetical protein [Acidimicrobiales bacterium]